MPPPIGVVSGPLMEVVAAGLDGRVGQPGVVVVVGFLAGVDLEPVDLALAAVGLLHCGVQHPHRGAPDVGAGAIALDERNNGVVRDRQLAVADGDPGATGRGCELGVCHEGIPVELPDEAAHYCSPASRP